ncbi:MAG: hypothetical protein Q9201_001089 [Fulgogasparrea decipioides]
MPLIQLDSRPEMTDSDVSLALHSTRVSSDYDSLHSTVERIADLLENRGGRARTPLHYATRNWRLRSFLYLLPLSNVNAQDCRGETVLHQAVRKGQLELVRLTLGFEIDIERRSKIDMAALIGESTWFPNYSKGLLKPIPFFVMFSTINQSKSGPIQRQWITVVPSDDLQSLQLLSESQKEEQVYFWKDGLTALDYADCIGSHAMVQLLEARTKVRTSGIKIGLDSDFNEHCPERNLDTSQFESADGDDDPVNRIRESVFPMRELSQLVNRVDLCSDNQFLNLARILIKEIEKVHRAIMTFDKSKAAEQNHHTYLGEVTLSG